VRRGQPCTDLPPSAFVLFLQNHDQTGNRAFGERLLGLARPQAMRAAVALQLLSPQIPLVFMGEEAGADTPFLYFTSHPPALAAAVRDGRRREFAGHPDFADPRQAARIPDPNDPATFAASRPPPAQANGWSAFYRALLSLRRRELMPRLPGTRSTGTAVLTPGALRAGWRLGDGAQLTLWTNLGEAPIPCEIATPLCVLAESREGAAAALAAGILPPDCTVACLRDMPGPRHDGPAD
jgi:maltooligosyltrehalose trehalohydrolase